MITEHPADTGTVCGEIRLLNASSEEDGLRGDRYLQHNSPDRILTITTDIKATNSGADSNMLEDSAIEAGAIRGTADDRDLSGPLDSENSGK